LTEDGVMRVSAEDRCPVCAMLPARNEKFAGAIQLEDGRTFYFCSAGCMIRSWRHPFRYLGVDRGDLARPVTRDYFTGEALDAREALWVAGSDVVGPMGPALVPLKTTKDLPVFRKRHGAKTTFRLSELDDDLWQILTGNHALRD
jgi:nitrous oxide reductase accessory protein NosL